MQLPRQSTTSTVFFFISYLLSLQYLLENSFKNRGLWIIVLTLEIPTCDTREHFCQFLIIPEHVLNTTAPLFPSAISV